MANISKVAFNSIEYAKKTGAYTFLNIPLKDKSTAKFFHSPNRVDCFILRKGEIVEATGAKGSLESVLAKCERVLSRLQQKTTDNSDLMKMFYDNIGSMLNKFY